jgi:hypothetical protein
MLIAPASAAQQAAQNQEATIDEIYRLAQEAREEVAAFREQGGRNSDPNHPVLKWSRELWSLHQKHRGTRAGSLAATQAIRLLVSFERISEAAACADKLAPGDSAWLQVAPLFLEAGSRGYDPVYLKTKLRKLIADPSAEALRPGFYYYLGLAHERAGEDEAGMAAFESVLKLYPESSWAKYAREGVEELSVVGIGKPAPAIEAQTRDGSRITLESYRGRAVLLIFWAST